MNLILIRHAVAIDKDADIIDDYRFLTPEGRISFRKTVRTIVKKGISPTVILTSPLVRALQTADVVAEALDFDGPLLIREELKRDFGTTELHKLVEEFPEAKELVLVGHDPDFSAVAASMLNRPSFSMKKGAALRLKIDPADPGSSVKFRWLIVGKKCVDDPDKLAG